MEYVPASYSDMYKRKFNIAPEKSPKRKVGFQPSIFRGYVHFLGCNHFGANVASQRIPTNQPTQMNWLLLKSSTYRSLKSLVENAWDVYFHMTIPAQRGVILPWPFPKIWQSKKLRFEDSKWIVQSYQILDGTFIPTKFNIQSTKLVQQKKHPINQNN